MVLPAERAAAAVKALQAAIASGAVTEALRGYGFATAAVTVMPTAVIQEPTTEPNCLWRRNGLVYCAEIPCSMHDDLTTDRSPHLAALITSSNNMQACSSRRGEAGRKDNNPRDYHFAPPHNVHENLFIEVFDIG